MTDLGHVMMYDGDLGRAWARERDATTGQEFLMEVQDFVAEDGSVVAGACLATDGECSGQDGYCGGCGGCMIMQAVHAGYRVITTWSRMQVSHRLAWDDALQDLEAECDEVERLAAETIRLVDPDNAGAKRGGLQPGALYSDGYGRVHVVW